MEITVTIAAIAVFAAIAIGVINAVIASNSATVAGREIDSIIRAAQRYRGLPAIRGTYDETLPGSATAILAAGTLTNLTEDIPIPGFTDGVDENVYGEDVTIQAVDDDTVTFEYTFNNNAACENVRPQLGTDATNPALGATAPACTAGVLRFQVD